MFLNFICIGIIFIISSDNAFSQNPQIKYSKLNECYSTNQEITCTAKIFSFGLIDQLCAIKYNIYKDDFSTPISNINNFGNIKYTVRGKGSDYITQSITQGSGYICIKHIFTTYMAFTLGIFDNYCVARNRPVNISMSFNEPGEYIFNSEIQSCSNSKSWLFTNYTSNGSKGCDSKYHKDYASSTCNDPSTLYSESINITVCNQSHISFLKGDTEYYPNEDIFLVYKIGEYDNEIIKYELPNWIIPIIDDESNTLFLTGHAPAYIPEKTDISFSITTYSNDNPVRCPDATITQIINILNPDNALEQLDKHTNEHTKMPSTNLKNKN